MVFKKIRHNIGEEIFKIKIENPNGALLENWVIMKGDFLKVVNIISKKYGLRNSNRDLDWAM